jgi:hypothetical protein
MEKKYSSKKGNIMLHFVNLAEYCISEELYDGLECRTTPDDRENIINIYIEALKDASVELKRRKECFDKMCDLHDRLENYEEDCCKCENIDDPQCIKVFISQPMKNKTNDEILKERECIKTLAAELLSRDGGVKKDKIVFINSFQKDKKGKPLYLLGESLKMLSEADMAFFPANYEEYRGCNIEYKCAYEYGIDIETYNKGIIE